MYRDLVYRPGMDTAEVETLPYRPGSDTSFAEVTPYKPRTHTPFNPGSDFPYDIRPSTPRSLPPKLTMELDLLAQKPRGYDEYGRPVGFIVEDRPKSPGIYEIPTSADPDPLGKDFLRKIDEADRAAKTFLDLFMLDRGLMAGYVPFKGVAPADVDPGGPESPETLARFAEYLKMRRNRGDFERARDRLIQQGFPLGGV